MSIENLTAIIDKKCRIYNNYLKYQDKNDYNRYDLLLSYFFMQYSLTAIN